MTRKLTPKRKLRKRGPREVYVRTEGENGAALAKLLESNRGLTRTAKREFDTAHAKGMDSLKSGDTQGFGEAIKREAAAIEKLSKVRLPKPK